MSIGAGLVLIAIGAILRFGISTVSTHGFSVHTIGDILMLVGILGVLWLVVWAPTLRTHRSENVTVQLGSRGFVTFPPLVLPSFFRPNGPWCPHPRRSTVGLWPIPGIQARSPGRTKGSPACPADGAAFRCAPSAPRSGSGCCGR